MRNQIEVNNIAKIVTEHTGRKAVHLFDKPHAELRDSKTADCWGGPIIVDEYEIAVSQPSPSRKGNTLWAFFTFQKLTKLNN